MGYHNTSLKQSGCPACHDAVPAGHARGLELRLSDGRLRGLRHRYACEGLSVRRLAAESGLSRQRLVHVLRHLGLDVPAGGAGRPRPWTRSADPDGLRDVLSVLYSDLRLSSARIGTLLDMPERRVRMRLREFGIRRRSRGRCNREDRRQVDPRVLTELLARCDLPGTEISRRTGEPYPAVLRSAHVLGLPVRHGGRADTAGGRLRTLEALYRDALVHDALRRFGVPLVPAGTPLWQRFPEPVTLTHELLTELYTTCGLSTPHIELLTGQPAATVQRRMREFGIPLRAPGGRAPIWQRWRTPGHHGS
ncbi:MAG TPA: hypothetical protein VG756_02595 [Pseudonocardiaceae bacterium]|nr:hypothetical protein [Pseudonocardiaceae bacterium]